MALINFNRPKHSFLLMPVRLRNERWPKNKVRVLSCDIKGRLFTQLIGIAIYKRIIEETQQMEVLQKNCAAIYWDTGGSKPRLFVFEIGKREAWALERILEHALRSAVIPDMLTSYLKEIIRLGEVKFQESLAGKDGGTYKTTSTASSKVLGRLPYYRENDVEVSIPIYKAELAFPLIILKRLPQANNTAPSQPLLVLDSDGDLVVASLPLEKIDKAERKLDNCKRKEKASCLICSQKPKGITIEVMEISEPQRKALGTVTRYFDETGKGKQPLSDAVGEVLYKAKEMA